MKMTNECLACCARGSLNAARLATTDTRLQQQVVQKVFSHLATMDLKAPPPLTALRIHQIIEQVTGVKDPYKHLKDKYNDLALALYPELIEKGGTTTFEKAVRLAIAGNIIDFGVHNKVGKKKVIQTVEDALIMPVNGQIDRLQAACGQSRRILWLADNAGEIVFDRLLLSMLDTDKVIYAVRGGPVQNDATMEDAVYCGLTDMVKVIDTGAAIPGVILEYCSEPFNRVFKAADLIIAKGQGNFETLDVNDPRIFFLFKAKCPVVSAHAQVQLHDMVIKQGGS
jgi:uncharacterized protein with ATP-grasp and redox domains